MNDRLASRNWTRRLINRALIMAVYMALTLVFAPIAYGSVQFRVSEALMVLPVISSASIWGVTLGCFLANVLNPYNLGPVDIVFGTLATLLAAVVTRYLRTKLFQDTSELSWKNPKLYLLPLPTILANALIVGFYLPYLLLGSPGPDVVSFSMLTVGLGEVGVLYALGLPLLMAILRLQEKNPQLRLD